MAKLLSKNESVNFDDAALKCEKHIFLFTTTGYSTNENPLKKIYPFIVLRLLMFFTLSRILRYLLKPLKQTAYVYNLLAGIILGPTVLGVIFGEYQKLKDSPSQTQFVNFGGYFGLIYYAFITAVQIDGVMILRTPTQAKLIGVSSAIVPFIVVLIPNMYLNPIGFNTWFEVLLFSMQIPKTSLVNVAPTLQELNLLTTELGQLALPGALINDFILWSFLLVIIMLKEIMNFVKSVLPIIVLVIFNIYALRPAMKYVVQLTPKGQPIKEIYIVAILVTAGVMTFIWDWVAGGPVMGIILFGLVVPNGPPLGSAIVERCQMFIQDFLLPLVYLAVGDMVRLIDLNINWRAHAMFQGTIVLGYLAKVIAVTLNGVAYNMSVGKAVSLGLIMNASGIQQSQFYWSLWLRQRITRPIASQMVMSNLLVTILTVPLSAWLFKRTKKKEDSIKGFELSMSAAASSGFSKMQILTCVEHEDDVASIISLLKATNNLETSPLSLYMVHLNELVGQVTPSLIIHKKHRRICKHNGCVPIESALNKYREYSNKRVDVQFLTMIAPLKGMPEAIARLAQEKLIPFIILPVITFGGRIQKQNNHKIFSSGLRCKIQEHAPCTVGIFLDMGLIDKEPVKYNNETLPNLNRDDQHVLAIFFGGRDDREVLAYARRILGHPNMTLTVLRVFFTQYNKKDDTETNINEEEKLRDEELINVFKANVIKNDKRVAYREIQVFELSRVIEVIASLNVAYDLIIMGRCHGEFDMNEGEMSILSESPELGFFGEYVSSTKFSWGKVSILILQHCVAFEKECLQNSSITDNELF